MSTFILQLPKQQNKSVIEELRMLLYFLVEIKNLERYWKLFVNCHQTLPLIPSVMSISPSLSDGDNYAQNGLHWTFCETFSVFVFCEIYKFINLCKQLYRPISSNGIMIGSTVCVVITLHLNVWTNPKFLFIDFDRLKIKRV